MSARSNYFPEMYLLLAQFATSLNGRGLLLAIMEVEGNNGNTYNGLVVLKRVLEKVYTGKNTGLSFMKWWRDLTTCYHAMVESLDTILEATKVNQAFHGIQIDGYDHLVMLICASRQQYPNNFDGCMADVWGHISREDLENSVGSTLPRQQRIAQAAANQDPRDQRREDDGCSDSLPNGWKTVTFKNCKFPVNPETGRIRVTTSVWRRLNSTQRKFLGNYNYENILEGVEPYQQSRGADMEDDNDEDDEEDLLVKIEKIKTKLKNKRKRTVAALETNITEEDDKYDEGKGSKTGAIIGRRKERR